MLYKSVIIILTLFIPAMCFSEGLASHVAHLESILALGSADHYNSLIMDQRFQPYFIYGMMFPDLEYTNKYKSILTQTYQDVRDMTIKHIVKPLNGLTYEIALSDIPDANWPLGIDTHDEKYGMQFAEYLLQACASDDPPGPDPGPLASVNHTAKLMKLAFALGYYCHLAIDVAGHDFMIPRITSMTDLGDIQIIKNPAGFSDPNAQMEGIIETLIDHYYGNPDRVKNTVFWDIYVYTDQVEPSIVEMDTHPGYSGDSHIYYDGTLYTGMNPVLGFFQEVLTDWINNNPWHLPAEYKKGYPISSMGLLEIAEVFRFVNRFYPALVGNGDFADEFGHWIGNHLWIKDIYLPYLTFADFWAEWKIFDVRGIIMRTWGYKDCRDLILEKSNQEIRLLTGLLFSNSSEADQIVNNNPTTIDATEYNRFKSKPLFTNTTGIITTTIWEEYKNLAVNVYQWVGPNPPEGHGDNWYYDWSPWHENSMRWGALSSLNNLLSSIYSSNPYIGVYDAYFTVEGVRVTSSQQNSTAFYGKQAKAIVEIYNTSNVSPINVRLRVKKDHRSGDYALDPTM